MRGGGTRLFRGLLFSWPLVVGSPASRFLRSATCTGLRTSLRWRWWLGSCCVGPTSLRSSGAGVVLPAVVLYACVGLCLASRRLPASVDGRGKAKVKVNGASGGPGSENRGGHGRAAVWSVLGFWVAVTGWGALLACPQRQSGTCRGRNRRWFPLAVARLLVRRLRPRQNPDRASPARRGEHPNLRGDVCAALGPGAIPPGRRCKILLSIMATIYAGQAYYENESFRRRVPEKYLWFSFLEPSENAPFVSAPR